MLTASARPDRDTLVAALAARRLDRTLTSALPALDPADDQALGPLDLPAFDTRVGGGWPRGQLSELVGPASSGRTSLWLRTLAAATARGELVALVDVLDRLDVASAVAAGVDLSRLLWIRGHVVTHPGLSRDLNPRAMEQAIKALTLLLQAGAMSVVVFDAGDAPLDAFARLPFTTWLRLQRMVEGGQTICLLVGPEPMARSAAGLTVKLEARDRARARVSGRTFDGLAISARVIRARTRVHESTTLQLTSQVAYE
jgi:recombination protein RecA